MIARKLLIKPGKSVLLINPPPGYAAALDLPSGASLTTAAEADVAQVFVRNRADLAGLAAVLQDSGRRIVWVCYPKGGKNTDLNRDLLWQALHELGVVGVTLVSVDQTWSAMRVRPRQPGE